MKKKVIFFTRLFYPHLGGIERHILELSNRLIKKKYDVTVITTLYDDSLSYSDTVHGITVIRFQQPKIKILGILYTWLWLVKNISLIKQSEIIHIHDVFIWYWPFKLIYPGKPVFTTIHGRWGKYPVSLSDIIQKKIAAGLSDGVISIGAYIDKYYGITSDIISYGATFKPKLATKNQRLVIYVGRLDSDIALNTIFEVFKNIKGYKKEFCGDGELKKEAYLYGKVHGFVDPGPYLRKAKFCFASGYLTILEAMAAKCLVFAAYSNPLQKDYYELTPFNKFIISAGNYAELLDKFNYYSKNTKAYRKKVEAGFKWVSDQTWEKMAENYLSLWQKRVKPVDKNGKEKR